MKKILVFLILTSALIEGSVVCNAQLTDIVSFTGTTTSPEGQIPQGNVIRSGNVLYGMSQGGTYGNIFSVDTNGNNYKDLFDFNGSNGYRPTISLTLVGGMLYGMTENGGVNSYGNIFSIDTNGAGFRSLWSFDVGGDTNGSEPDGSSLLYLGGKLYGMTLHGGVHTGGGNIFRIDTDGGGYKDLWDFDYNGSTNGAFPYGNLTPSVTGDTLFGMTQCGGINKYGNVFSIDTDGTGYTDLWDFDYTNGWLPIGSLVLFGKTLFGMTPNGGSYNDGVIFSIETNGNNFKDLLVFNGTNGAPDDNSLSICGNELYGMTFGGEGFHGNIFKMDTNGNNFINIFTFDNTDGLYPDANLLISGNQLYGTTEQGGLYGYGVVFGYGLLGVAVTYINVICNDAENGSATVNAAGGISPYTYQWNDANSQTTATATGLSAGTYTVYVYDSYGVKDSSIVSITQPNELRDSVSATNATCNGGSGSAIANVGGGTTPYTYKWSDESSQTTATATGLSAGSYSVSIQDACGVDSIVNITITQPGEFRDSISYANISCNGGTSNAMANLRGGSTPYTYIWSNGETTANATGLSAGTYNVSVKDACGVDSVSHNITITQPVMLGNTHVTLLANVTCYGDNNGSASVNPSGGSTPYTYTWSNGETTATVNNLTAGTYSVSTKDGCGTDSLSNTITISQPTNALNATVTIINVTCHGDDNGIALSAVSGGTLPYTYLWTGGAGTNADASNLTAGTYTIGITDANGCTSSNMVIITQPSMVRVVASINQAIICNGEDGGLLASPSGGAAPYTYSWTSGSTTATAIVTSGSYTVTVTDANECTSTADVIISQPGVIGISTIVHNITCYTADNGSATATVTGGTSPYTYLWSSSGGNTNSTVTGLSVGTYTLTVTDNGGCSNTNSVVITQPVTSIGGISAIIITNESCFGDDDGSAISTATGGSLPYTYNWTGDGGSNAIASNLSAGTYTVTITDNGDCSVSVSVEITQPSVLSVSSYSDPDNGTNNGVAGATVSGGTLPYTYLWEPGNGTASSISNLSAGNYCCSISDANDCTQTTCLTVIYTLGIGNIIGSSNINIYPDPTAGSFVIAGVTQGQIIEIYDCLGQKLSSTAVSNNIAMEFDISTSANGVYLIRILNIDGTLINEKKILKTQ